MKDKLEASIYTQMQRFANLTKILIINGNIKRAKRCLKIAEGLLNNGNAEIKNAVANIYVFSVTCFMEIHHCSVKDLFPESLNNEFKRQINASSL